MFSTRTCIYIIHYFRFSPFIHSYSKCIWFHCNIWNYHHFLFYLIIIFILYFVFIYVFIYALQRLLVKLNRLNFWFIMLCAIVLTLIFSFSIFLLGSIDFSIFLIVSLFSIPIALMYWILLFSQHQKNHKSWINNFID